MGNDEWMEAKKKVGVILLAAGNSKRYQSVKLLEVIDGKKMYRHILELAAGLTVIPKIIVTQYEEIQENASLLGFEVVMNSDPDIGISHSIQLGLSKALEITPNLDAVLFSVCDQPYLNQTTLLQLLNVFQKTDKGIACVAHKEILGNPCIISKKYFAELFALRGDIGGKMIINKYHTDIEPLFVSDNKEMLDIDYKEDAI